MDPVNEACAPAAEEVPLVLLPEPQAPTWARHIVHFLQTGELPEEQEQAEKQFSLHVQKEEENMS